MHFLPLTLRTESNYYLDHLISDLANGKETIIKRNKGQSNLAKAASPAHWRFGLQSSNPGSMPAAQHGVPWHPMLVEREGLTGRR